MRTLGAGSTSPDPPSPGRACADKCSAATGGVTCGEVGPGFCFPMVWICGGPRRGPMPAATRAAPAAHALSVANHCGIAARCWRCRPPSSASSSRRRPTWGERGDRRPLRRHRQAARAGGRFDSPPSRLNRAADHRRTRARSDWIGSEARSRFLYVVAFSAENRYPLFRKMLQAQRTRPIVVQRTLTAVHRPIVSRSGQG